MSDGLELFNQILFLNLRPWMQGQVSEQKYIQLLLEVTQETYQFQPLYKLDFLKPLNAKRKYYSSLIENTTIAFLNTVIKAISNASDKGKKYRLNNTLNKVVEPKLKEVQQVIKKFEYTLEAVKTSPGADGYEEIRDNAFIIQLLKFNLIHTYLEIHNRYAHTLNEPQLNEEDIRLHYFSEAVIEKTLLVKADNVELPKVLTKIKEQTTAKFLPVVKADFRPYKKGMLSYEVMIKNPERFASFEEELYVQELIDHDRNFKNEYGQLQELAAVYHTLRKKGYFNKRNFLKKKDITPLDVRKFLDHRYNASVDKQFRTWANEPEELATFVENHFWLTHLPAC